MGVDQTRAPRFREPWTEDEYARLVEELRAGRSLHEITALLRRSLLAVKGRVRFLIPADERAGLTVSEHESWVREALTSPTSDYDWRQALRRTTRPKAAATGALATWSCYAWAGRKSGHFPNSRRNSKPPKPTSPCTYGGVGSPGPYRRFWSVLARRQTP
jgi:hypothetical protein